MQQPHHLGHKPGRPHGRGGISGGKRFHIEFVASPSAQIRPYNSEGTPCHLQWENYRPFEKHLLVCYWVLVETEHLIMEYHMTVRNYIITNLVVSDLPSPKDCCCTLPATIIRWRWYLWYGTRAGQEDTNKIHEQTVGTS